MLIAFFTINEPENPPADDKWLAPAITIIAKNAWRDACRALSSDAPYDTDGAMPFGLVYTTEFTNTGGLSSAREICEQWRPGEGICVGLVFEGKATGPLYGGAGLVGVRPEDIDRPVPEMFARQLDVGVRAAALGLEVDHEYHVSDWALYERHSALMSWSY
jgi:hypothetical protein